MQNTGLNAQKIDIQGHRGARGLFPENSLPAFLKAAALEVSTIEMDVVISKDKKVVVSHEPYMSAAICKDFDGKDISVQDQKSHNIYKMNYDEIKKYDCGSAGNEKFPQQEKSKTYKPLLSEVFTSVEAHIKDNNLSKPKYNIEIKSSPKGDGEFHPLPEEYTDLVYNEIKKYLSLDRVIIQSFDQRVLRYLHKKDPSVTLAYLVENKLSFKSQIKKLGFTPDIYSPHYQLLDGKVVEKIHQAGMKVIPWTVNDMKEIKLVLRWGVDGVITDYPDRALSLQ